MATVGAAFSLSLGVAASLPLTVLAPIMVWIGVGYFALPALRRYYGARKFAFDVSVLGLSVLPWMPHFFALWERRGAMAWLGEPRYGLIFDLIGPLFVPGMVAFLTVAGKHKRETRDDLTMLFGVIVVAHLGCTRFVGRVRHELSPPSVRNADRHPGCAARRSRNQGTAALRPFYAAVLGRYLRA